jgi:hypothetical protein
MILQENVEERFVKLNVRSRNPKDALRRIELLVNEVVRECMPGLHNFLMIEIPGGLLVKDCTPSETERE